MMYSLKWDFTALNDLRKFPKVVSKRIINKLTQLKENPKRYLERLSGDPGYKIRVGDYRIIVDLVEHESVIIIRAVGHRKKIYKRKL